VISKETPVRHDSKSCPDTVRAIARGMVNLVGLRSETSLEVMEEV
jgi:hypothetical protein